MTERVYYTSDATDGRAQIIACTAEVDGRYAIELDRTLFHPARRRSTGRPRLDSRAGG
ncbi:metal-dependent hydrolase [Klebsiella aerogenes]|nr:metal-dependent hydrolase [Klebsiella aerogenes]